MESDSSGAAPPVDDGLGVVEDEVVDPVMVVAVCAAGTDVTVSVGVVVASDAVVVGFTGCVSEALSESSPQPAAASAAAAARAVRRARTTRRV